MQFIVAMGTMWYVKQIKHNNSVPYANIDFDIKW